MTRRAEQRPMHADSPAIRARRAVRQEGRCVLACDLGGSKLHLAVATLTGAVIAEVVKDTDRRSARALLSQIRQAVSAMLDEAGIERRQVVRAIIGMPGVIDPLTGGLSLSPNLPDFGRMNVSAAMARAFGCPVRIENDVNLAVLGEQRHGAGRGKANIAFIALGTGIGMGLLCDGRLVRGAHGAAAEIAYLPIGGDPFDPPNVRAGTFESMVGTPGILQRFVKSGGKGASDVRGVLAAMAAGDPIALQVIDEAARWTALGIAAVVALLDPELIVLGGGFGTRREILARIKRHLRHCLARRITVAPSRLGNRAALLGAVAMCLADPAQEARPGAVALRQPGGKRRPKAKAKAA